MFRIWEASGPVLEREAWCYATRKFPAQAIRRASLAHGLRPMIKGERYFSKKRVENGDLILSSMRRNHISRHDLEEDLRLGARMENASQVKTARVERSGDISFIEK
jgi:hypothetical protein